MADGELMATDSLRRSIITIIVVKFAIVAMAAVFVFGPRQRPVIDDNALSHRFFNHPAR